MNTEQEYFETNRALWNEKTKHHTTSAFYDMEGWLAGNTSLKDIELGLLGDVKDKSILHMHCHFGQDSMSLARMGAKVTGTDIADDAIAFATKTAEELKLDAKFIRTDTYNIPDVITEQYDIVFASYGVIGWLPDMQRFADIVASRLKPGGKLILVEFHPVVWMFDNNLEEIAYSYFNVAPIIEHLEGTYADKEADIKMKEVGWNHTSSDVIQALINAGITIAHFGEYDYSPYDCFRNMVPIADGKWQVKGKKGLMPMVFSIVGKKV